MNALMQQLGDLRAWDSEQKAKQAAPPLPERVVSSAPAPKRATNAELLVKARHGRTEWERSQAAEQLRRQIKTLSAAAIARHGHHLSANEVEDLAQDVFVRLLQTSAEVEPTPAYIARIAVNLLIDQRRHLVRRGQEKGALSLDDTNEDGMPREVADPKQDVEDGVLVRMQQVAIRSALEKFLKPNEATVLLRRAEGASHDEIAEELGLKSANVRKQCERSLKRLRSLAETGQLSAMMG